MYQQMNSKPGLQLLIERQRLVGELSPRIQARPGGLPEDSVALYLHIRTVAPERIGRRVGTLNQMELAVIVEGVRELVEK